MSDRATQVGLENLLEENISPATEDKQDDIISAISGFQIPPYDYISRGWVGGTFTETWTFKTGGAGGTTIGTVVVVYDDVDKSNIVTVTKT